MGAICRRCERLARPQAAKVLRPVPHVAPRDHLWAAGMGMAFLDGLFRFAVARALDSRKGWSVDLFIEVR